jgi:hypothetical protein
LFDFSQAVDHYQRTDLTIGTTAWKEEGDHRNI